MPTHYQILCSDCGWQDQTTQGMTTCPKCGSPWLEARYPTTTLGSTYPTRLLGRRFDLWRYAELLPVDPPAADLCMGEGGTPLYRIPNLGMMLGCPHIYLKDERQGPTASFKDRQASLSIAALKEAGIQEMVVASTGNVAIAYSAYAARAGIKIWAFLTSQVPAAKMHEVAIYGTQVIKVTGSYDQAKQLAAQFAQQRGLYYDTGARSIPCTEGMKTLAFEIAEQLGNLLGPTTPELPWRAPDWYIQAVSGGLGPLGVIKGFIELKEMGLIDRVPRIACIQAEGCAPMVHAWEQEFDVAEPIRSPQTLIATLATGDPGKSYTLLSRKMRAQQGGTFESVSDSEAFRAMHYLGKMEGVSVEPAAAVAIAGLVKMVRSGKISPDDLVVVNITGHTIPVGDEVIGEGWSQDISLAQPEKQQADSPEEGLLAALSRITTDRFASIEIVDDTADSRRLVRRILQSQGSFTIFEACDGPEALEVAHREHPDLMILDLMMPGMDGFSVLDALKKSPDTAAIPVIVVTAKELTPTERKRLNGHIRSLMQKGDFMSDDLINEIQTLVRETNV